MLWSGSPHNYHGKLLGVAHLLSGVTTNGTAKALALGGLFLGGFLLARFSWCGLACPEPAEVIRSATTDGVELARRVLGFSDRKKPHATSWALTQLRGVKRPQTVTQGPEKGTREVAGDEGCYTVPLVIWPGC